MKTLAILALLGLGSFSANSSQSLIEFRPGPIPVTVAVIDTGSIAGHPALEGAILPGYNFLSADRDVSGIGRGYDVAPELGAAKCKHSTIGGDILHGMQVASIVAGNGHLGVQGANPGAKILPVKAIGRCGMNREDLIDSMRWAAGLPVPGVPINQHPARIINVSVTGGMAACGLDLQAAINELNQKGVFVVAAAGQGYGKGIGGEPANCKHVISVGALDHFNEIADYSAVDPRMTLYAPGGTILKNTFGDTTIRGYVTANYDQKEYKHGIKLVSSTKEVAGTSFASAYVAGFISKWLSHDPTLTPEKFLQMRPAYGSLVAGEHWKLNPQLSPWYVFSTAQTSLSARYINHHRLDQ